MKKKNGKIAAVILSILLIVMIPPHDIALADSSITVAVTANTPVMNVGDEVTFTISMSDAGATDFNAFSFKINLPDGLAYKTGSGSIVPSFLSSTGIAMSAFDEKPYLMASGFGDAPYNGGALDIAVFTCTATATGQMIADLNDVKLYNTSALTIPNSVVPVTIIVNLNRQSGDGNPSQPDIGTENPVAWNNPFMDVSSEDWYYIDLAWAHSNGLVNGTGNNRFNPQIPMSRAMLVTVLYRFAGAPTVTSNTTFSDVAKDVWYTDAVAWASASGIVNGINPSKFVPDDNITREQIATILFRYARFMDMDISANEDISRFTDAKQVSDYAKDAISWAVALKIITGRPRGVLDPKVAATRAEVAVVLHRYSDVSSHV